MGVARERALDERGREEGKSHILITKNSVYGPVSVAGQNFFIFYN